MRVSSLETFPNKKKKIKRHKNVCKDKKQNLTEYTKKYSKIRKNKTASEMKID